PLTLVVFSQPRANRPSPRSTASAARCHPDETRPVQLLNIAAPDLSGDSLGRLHFLPVRPLIYLPPHAVPFLRPLGQTSLPCPRCCPDRRDAGPGEKADKQGCLSYERAARHRARPTKENSRSCPGTPASAANASASTASRKCSPAPARRRPVTASPAWPPAPSGSASPPRWSSPICVSMKSSTSRSSTPPPTRSAGCSSIRWTARRFPPSAA